jgi:hypothetical protein
MATAAAANSAAAAGAALAPAAPAAAPPQTGPPKAFVRGTPVTAPGSFVIHVGSPFTTNSTTPCATPGAGACSFCHWVVSGLYTAGSGAPLDQHRSVTGQPISVMDLSKSGAACHFNSPQGQRDKELLGDHVIFACPGTRNYDLSVAREALVSLAKSVRLAIHVQALIETSPPGTMMAAAELVKESVRGLTGQARLRRGGECCITKYLLMGVSPLIFLSHNVV